MVVVVGGPGEQSSSVPFSSSQVTPAAKSASKQQGREIDEGAVRAALLKVRKAHTNFDRCSRDGDATMAKSKKHPLTKDSVIEGELAKSLVLGATQDKTLKDFETSACTDECTKGAAIKKAEADAEEMEATCKALRRKMAKLKGLWK